MTPCRSARPVPSPAATSTTMPATADAFKDGNAPTDAVTAYCLVVDLVAACRAFVAVSGYAQLHRRRGGRAHPAVRRQPPHRRPGAALRRPALRPLHPYGHAHPVRAGHAALGAAPRRSSPRRWSTRPNGPGCARSGWPYPAICAPRRSPGSSPRPAGTNCSWRRTRPNPPNGPSSPARWRSGAALVAVPPAEAAWRVPLGLAGRAEPALPALYLETLRSGAPTATRRPAGCGSSPRTTSRTCATR